jgi:hypothetical protein
MNKHHHTRRATKFTALLHEQARLGLMTMLNAPRASRRCGNGAALSLPEARLPSLQRRNSNRPHPESEKTTGSSSQTGAPK